MKSYIKKKHIKHKIKDSVFTSLFKIPKYKLELYKVLNPKDKDVTIKDIKTITLESIMMNDIYNDLGLLVKDKIIFLLEAQSTWSINILVREFLYLAETYKNYFEDNKINLYSTKKVELPIPKLYVIYTGNKKLSKKEISLNEEYFNNESLVDIRVKIITLKEKSNDILMQYIKFSKEIDNDSLKKDSKTLEKIINKCIKNNILKEYLLEHKKEVRNMLSVLYDEDYLTECYEKELYDDAMQKGMQKGIEKGMEKGIEKGMKKGMKQGTKNVLDRLVKQGIISKEEAKKQLAIA